MGQGPMESSTLGVMYPRTSWQCSWRGLGRTRLRLSGHTAKLIVPVSSRIVKPVYLSVLFPYHSRLTRWCCRGHLSHGMEPIETARSLIRALREPRECSVRDLRLLLVAAENETGWQVRWQVHARAHGESVSATR